MGHQMLQPTPERCGLFTFMDKSCLSPQSPLSRLLQGYDLYQQAKGCRPSSRTTSQRALKQLVTTLPLECVKDAQLITSDHLTEWAAGMEDLGYAPATRDQRISKVKAFFAWAQREQFLPSNPASHLKRPRQTWQPDPFSKDEVLRILDATKQGRTAIRDHALVCMFLDTGIRASELCALTLDSVDLSSGRVKVIDGKGGKDRTLILGKRCKNALWRYQMHRPDTWVPNLFVSERGAILHRTVLGRQIRIIGERAKVTPCYPHRFRHTFAVLYLKAGGDPFSLQYLLGHSDMAVTRQYVKLAAIDIGEMFRSPLDRL